VFSYLIVPNAGIALLKICERCKRSKLRCDFFPGRSWPDGLFPVCRACGTYIEKGMGGEIVGFYSR
jgi:hypothetical protein